MDRIKTLVLLMMLILVTAIFPFEYVRYTTADGLADNHVRDVAITDDGTVWIASSDPLANVGGLTKWDNNGFFSYYPSNTDGGLLCSTVNAVELDSSGNLWVASGAIPLYCEGGISVFDGMSWENYALSEIYGDLSTIISTLTFNLTGNLLIGGIGHTLCMLDSSESEFIMLHERHDSPEFLDIVDILVAPDNSIWLPSRHGNGILQIRDSTKTRYTTEDGLLSNTVEYLETDLCGNIWASFEPSGIMIFNGTGWINPFAGTIADTLVGSTLLIDEFDRKWTNTLGKIICISDTGYQELLFPGVTIGIQPIAYKDEKLYCVGTGLYVIDVSTIDWDWTPLPPYNVEEHSTLPEKLEIDVYPNPFNAALSISAPNGVVITIHDTQGRQVADLSTERVWDAKGQPSGVYLVRAQKRDVVEEEKVVLVR